MKTNPLVKIQEYGQSIWLDFIRRDMLVSGELKRLIDEDGLRGMTSNPAIFEKAITETPDYVSAIRGLVLEGKNTEAIYQNLAIDDIGLAADVLHTVFVNTDGRDGFVSIEVSPHLARDTDGTINEARYWWTVLNRPNVLVKVPATKEGLVAIEQLISEGININVTLLFGLERYSAVAEAYIRGLEKRLEMGLPLDKVSSVASFFLSRIDVLADPALEMIVKKGGPSAATAASLRGETAIASAKVAYQIYKGIFYSKRFRSLAQKGAKTQRVLWASTSSKDPSYSDVKYVEPLIGPDTVNTLPMETLNAYRDHGNPASRLEDDAEKAKNVLKTLEELGIDLPQLTQRLEDEGVDKFIKPFDKLMGNLDKRRKDILVEPAGSQPQ